MNNDYQTFVRSNPPTRAPTGSPTVLLGTQASVPPPASSCTFDPNEFDEEKESASNQDTFERVFEIILTGTTKKAKRAKKRVAKLKKRRPPPIPDEMAALRPVTLFRMMKSRTVKIGDMNTE